MISLAWSRHSEGIKLAVQLGEAFKIQKIPFNLASTSDLGRARNTAQLILKYSINFQAQLIMTKRLQEVAFRYFEGDQTIFCGKLQSQVDLNRAVNESSTDEAKIQVLSTIKKLDKLHLAENFNDLKMRIRYLLDQILSTNASSLAFFFLVMVC